MFSYTIKSAIFVYLVPANAAAHYDIATEL